MNQYHDLPTNKNFGLEFNYNTWSAGTAVTLANVPWDSTYRDIVHFTSDAAITSYLLDTTSRTFRNLSYSGLGVPIKLDIPFVEAQKYNYLRAFNESQPIEGDSPSAFYYFILDVVRVAPNTTLIYIQLDVWQSFGRTTEFGNCYIEQGHIGIANTQAENNFGRDYLTIPEGLDVGGEYAITKQYKTEVASARTAANPNYEIMIVSTVDLRKDPGTIAEPKLNTATGSALMSLPNGSNVYVFKSLGVFRDFLSLYSDKPWITQGVISIMAVPKLSRYGITQGAKFNLPGSTVSVWEPAGSTTSVVRTVTAPSWRNAARSALPSKYQKLYKLLTYPYTVLELTSYTGQPIILKPESWQDPNGTVVEVAHLAPPSQRLTFYPSRYNASPGSPVEGVNDGGEFLDMATGITNFPTFSLVNDSYAGYLASNSNSIAFQNSSADWSNTKALAGADNTANNATMGINASTDQSNIAVNASIQQNNLNNSFATGRAVMGAAQGIASGAAMGPGGVLAGVSSAAMAGAGTAMEINQNNASTAISAGASRAGNSRAGQLAGDLRDSNKGYANMVANGDYSQAIAGINAKTQDAKLSQPSTSGQMGGDAFLLANYKWGYDVKVKSITGAALAAVGDYMLRYGYSINRFGKMPANFQVMTNFTYWKLKETYIISAKCPETYRQTLRGIFEKGVTVWSNPRNVGNINVDNNEILSGIVL